MNKYAEDDDDDSRADGSMDSFASEEEFGGPEYSSLDGSHSNLSSNIPDEMKIGAKETKFVLCSKLMTYLVLFLSAAAAGVTAYYITREQEVTEFESDFQGYARDISQSTQLMVRNKIGVGQSISLYLTSYAVDRKREFPYVTLPDFEVRVGKARALAQSASMIWVPLVDESQRKEWEKYSRENVAEWTIESLNAMGNATTALPPLTPYIHQVRTGEPVLGPAYTQEGKVLRNKHSVLWQVSPLTASQMIVVNSDNLYGDNTRGVTEMAVETGRASVSPMFNFELSGTTRYARAYFVNLVYSDFTNDAEIVGTVGTLVRWQDFFGGILPEGVQGLDVVLDDSCGQVYTFRLTGEEVTLRGEGDLHDGDFDDLKRVSTIGLAADDESTTAGDHDVYVMDKCVYQISIYATEEMKKSYMTENPIYYATTVVVIFIFTALVFLVYDWAVQLQQNKVLKTATRTQAIVSSLFPKNVQERIFKDVEEEVKQEEKGKTLGRFRGNRTKDQLRNFLDDGTEDPASKDTNSSLKSKPIADLFPEATVIFADIVGFTAWSSTREPTQVFTLLENIYHSFDEIAKRRRIFKVETVGDCYVAVSGLPEPRKDHAVAMARFSKDVLLKFREMVKQMVVELGPDTEDLGLRIGLHSGPVTAGVLRGERARFQLFGDTMNTTARMESTGSPNKIQMSQETADLLMAAGKTQWLTARREKVNAKGKGELQTYWLELQDDGTRSTSSGSASNASGPDGQAPDRATLTSSTHGPNGAPKPSSFAADKQADKHMRLISWNTDILSRLITQMIAGRESHGVVPAAPEAIKELEEKVSRTRLVLSEVTEIVNLPKFESTEKTIDPSRIELSEDVVNQLRDYVQTLAAMYRENPFHNFEHASHVTMSVLKLLSRIVAPADLKSDSDKNLHDHTYGITSDPMTQFAVVLSALIHDADHPGVPNSQLIKENASIASVYKNKSIAEQNSVDLAWDLLMDDAYSDLRRAIYVTEEDFLRFRQLVVNIVLATDIMDKDLGALRKGRWNKAFSECPTDESAEVAQNRKATIVMEHLIQASDVAHTMQHWHIYRKWNQRLFLEMYKAYAEGRSEKDPSDSWYEGEKGFFDFYIIPLARKLKDCGVFGVSSDEYLQYAQQNRKEWELKGREVVAELLEAARQKDYGSGED